MIEMGKDILITKNEVLLIDRTHLHPKIFDYFNQERDLGKMLSICYQAQILIKEYRDKFNKDLGMEHDNN